MIIEQKCSSNFYPRNGYVKPNLVETYLSVEKVPSVYDLCVRSYSRVEGRIGYRSWPDYVPPTLQS